MSEYSVGRRTGRTHNRAVRQGTERFDAEFDDLALDPAMPDLIADDDDDSEEPETQLDDTQGDSPEQLDTLIEELPPHWGEFTVHD